MRNCNHSTIYLIVLALLCSALAYGQADTATIVGTVRDSSGAVIVGGTITVTDTDTGTKTVTRTDSTGNYVVTPLRIGNYTVAVEAPGFKTETHSGIVLQVQDRLRVDFTMQVGAVSDAVNVQESVPVIQTESSSLGDVVASQQITDMPLNGRDYTQLATLTTGVVKITENGGGINGATSATNGNAGGAFAVNGTRGNLNNFMLDGIDNNSNDNAGNILSTNVDAIQEFKVQTSGYSAEFGRSGGAVINATIKSGTNAFHGTAFEFLRNSALDARGFFEPADQPKAPFRQNQFGGTVGGPIKRNKTFFFADYQGTRIGTAKTDISTVPTPAEIGGNFSALLTGTPAGQIFDPQSTTMVNGNVVRTPFAGNIIPGSRLDPISSAVAQLYPAPNVSGAMANNYIVNAAGNEQIDQGDGRMDHNITDRQQVFARFSWSQINRFQQPPLPGLADGGSYSTGNYIEDTRGAAIGYTFAISPTMVNELRIGFNRAHYVDNTPAYGQKYPGAGLAVPGVPNNATVNGLTLFQPNAYHTLGEPGYTPTTSTSQEFQYGDTLSIVHGKHSLKMGPQLRWSQFNLFQIGQPRGAFGFTGEFTSDSPTSGDGSGNGLADMLLGLPTSSTISTLTYFGNRQQTYGGFIQDDYQVSRTLTLNLGVRYDYTTPITEAHNQQSNFDFATGQLIVAGQNGASAGLVNADKNDFAPRVGFAWNPFKNTVIRSGYGRFFSYQEIRTGDPLQLAYNLPFFYQPTFISDGVTPILTVSKGFPSLNPSQAIDAGVTVSGSGVGSHLHAPVLDEWNFNIQQQLPAQILFEVAYVGSKSTHLQTLLDPNQDPVPGPGDIQSRRPYPQYGPFTDIVDRGNSNYSALEIKAEKRLSHGLMFLSAFTYSKSMNDQPEICCNGPWPQNSYNVASERGPSDFDQKFRWVSSFDYQLPVGKGQRYLNSSRAEDLILGGWHLGGIFTVHSGFYFSPAMGYDPSNTGSIGLLRTDRTCNGNFPSGQRSINNWFDASCFPLPTTYAFGNAGKNVLIGPGGVSGDFALRKMFAITDRQALEFRAEFFNAFNHAVFAQPDNYITDGPGATGVITSTVLPQREIQFALKLHF
ncbi:MAG TPA: TonB-dependent receptor [Bryobacteraceae bacterium]|nr:TonB-dependent receptor [Bryobacteraceae bacterium]